VLTSAFLLILKIDCPIFLNIFCSRSTLLRYLNPIAILGCFSSMEHGAMQNGCKSNCPFPIFFRREAYLQVFKQLTREDKPIVPIHREDLPPSKPSIYLSLFWGGIQKVF